jgi:S1-C subfamily serine protease
MKKPFIILVLLFVLIPNVRAFDKIKAQNNTVVITVDFGDLIGTCNGSVIKKEDNYATVLTAAHCVAEEGEIFVEEFRAYVIRVSKYYDLAYLFVPGKLEKEAIVLAPSNAKLNQKLYYVGEVLGYETNYIGRTISVLINFGTTLHVIQGNSGGAVLDEHNRLIGVITSGLFPPRKPKVAIISFAEDVNAINYFLRREIKEWKL